MKAFSMGIGKHSIDCTQIRFQCGGGRSPPESLRIATLAYSPIAIYLRNASFTPRNLHPHRDALVQFQMLPHALLDSSISVEHMFSIPTGLQEQIQEQL